MKPYKDFEKEIIIARFEKEIIIARLDFLNKFETMTKKLVSFIPKGKKSDAIKIVNSISGMIEEQAMKIQNLEKFKEIVSYSSFRELQTKSRRKFRQGPISGNTRKKKSKENREYYLDLCRKMKNDNPKISTLKINKEFYLWCWKSDIPKEARPTAKTLSRWRKLI